MSTKLQRSDELARRHIDVRTRLHHSLTYSLARGFFMQAKNLLESGECDLNERDTWWVRLIKKKPRTTAFIMQSKVLSVRANTMPLTIRRTPLMYCSLIQDNAVAYSIAQQLIENDADLTLCDSPNAHTALMYAAVYERTVMLRLLLDIIDLDDFLRRDKLGNTAMHWTSLSKCQFNCHLMNKIAFRKFNLESNSAKIRNSFGHTPADLCRFNNHYDCVKMHCNFNGHINSSMDIKIADTTTALNIFNEQLNFDFLDKTSFSLSSLLIYEESLSVIDDNSNNNCSKTELHDTFNYNGQQQIQQQQRLRPNKRAGSVSYSSSFLTWIDFYTKQFEKIKEPLIGARQTPALLLNQFTSMPITHISMRKSKSSTASLENNSDGGENGANYEIVPRISLKPVRVQREMCPVDKLNLAWAINEESGEGTWRNGINRIFETIEYEKTKSFRKSCAKVILPSVQVLTKGNSRINKLSGSLHSQSNSNMYMASNGHTNINIINNNLPLIQMQNNSCPKPTMNSSTLLANSFNISNKTVGNCKNSIKT